MEGRLLLTDVNGNQSDLLFYFKALVPTKPIKKEKEWVLLSPTRPYKLKTEKIFLQIPAGAFFDKIYLQYHVTRKVKPLLSQIHHFNSDGIPLHTNGVISIKTPKVKQEYLDKLCIVSIDDDGIIEYEGGLTKNGFVSSSISTLGSYAVDIDTIGPYIINMQPTDTIFNTESVLAFQVHDNISGIRKYSASVDDKWVLATYDLKSSLLKIKCKRLFHANCC